MPDPYNQPAEFSRKKARRAASDAAQTILSDLERKQSRRNGAVALYTWGALALLSGAIAATIGLLPNSNPSNTTTIVAQTDPAPRPTPPIEVVQGVADEKTPEDLASSQTSSLDELARSAPEPSEPFSREEVDQVLNEAELEENTTASVPRENEVTPADQPTARYGVEIGDSKSVPQLAQRYSALHRRAENLFAGLTPLVRLQEDATGMSARLIAGPFSSRQEMAQFCRTMKLRLTVECKESAYEGDPLADSR